MPTQHELPTRRNMCAVKDDCAVRASLIAFLAFLWLMCPANANDPEVLNLPDGRQVQVMPSPGPGIVVQKSLNGLTLFGLSFALGFGVSWFINRLR